MRGLVGEIALVSKTRNLIALIDGIALRSAGGSNDLQDVVGLVQRRNLLSTGLTAILALEGLDTGLGISSSLVTVPPSQLCPFAGTKRSL